MIRIDDYNALKTALARMCAALSEENVPEERVFDSKLVASELLVNALRYGGGSAMFSFALEAEEIHISVQSRNAFRPPEVTSRAAVASERGRGLFLVDSLVKTRFYSEEKGVCVIISRN